MPYKSTLRQCTTHYMRMLKELEKDKADLKTMHFGQNPHYNEFVSRIDEEIHLALNVVC